MRRITFLRAVESVSHTVNGAQGIVNANLIKKLVEKLKTETDEIKVKSILIPTKMFKCICTM